MTDHIPQVTCLGLLVADLLGKPVDALPERGRLALVPRMTLHVGGCAANTGIALARLGIPTAVVGKVGSDGLGDFLLNELVRNDVDVAGVVRDTGADTSSSMVLVSSDGERTFLHCPGANGCLTREQMVPETLYRGTILHAAGAFVMPGFDGEPMAQVLKEAQHRGMKTSLDTVWDATGRWMQTLRPCLPYVDYFMPGLAEARMIANTDTVEDTARALLEAGASTIILKSGAAGAWIATQAAVQHVGPYPIHEIDGTGAGDAFDAGFLCGLLHGLSPVDSAQLGNAVGALCVSEFGATEGVKSLSATRQFMAANQQYIPCE